MKSVIKICSLVLLSSLLLWACKKDEVKTLYNGGKTPVLTASGTTINMTPVDSTKSVVTFSWTDPAFSFSTGKSTLNVTHTLEIDSSGRNFAKPQVFSSSNVLQESSTHTFVKSYTGEEFNNILLKLGLTAGKTYKIDVRVSSSLYVDMSKLTSNVLTMTVTPYTTEPQPLYPVPDSLYIVGDATPGSWSNPVQVPAQRFTKIDKNTFGIIVQLSSAGKHYLFLPKNGDWGHKYAVADNSVGASKTEAAFTIDNGQDIPAPDAAGLYKIIVNFITGKYTVTPVAAGDIPGSLFLVGDATAGGWSNPVPVPNQQFTKTSAYTFELIVPLIGGKEYLLLPANGSWDHKYASPSKSAAGAKESGVLKLDGPDNFPAPDASGTYKIEVNFLTNTYKVTKM